MGDSMGDTTWYSKSLPLWNVHKDEIWGKATAAAEVKYGELYMTCTAGKACRNERKAELVEELKGQWKTVLDNFKITVENQIVKTNEEVSNTYLELIECAESN